ncbi:MAG: hypothetical protein ACRD5G_02995 [Candidatus Acidiferrales bacterium]
MPFVDVTFEQNAAVLRTAANLYAGWDADRSTKFYGNEAVDFPGDWRLEARVWCYANGPSERIPSIFPQVLRGEVEIPDLRATLTAGLLTIRMKFSTQLLWIKTETGKHAVDWRNVQIARADGVDYVFRFMAVFTSRRNRPPDVYERDVLPFLPGGRVESNRRRF